MSILSALLALFFPFQSEPSGDQFLSRSQFQHIQWAEKQFPVRLSSYGVGMPGGPIQQAKIILSSNEQVTIAMARQLLIVLTQDFLRRLNENRELRPYLKVFPFTSNNLEYAIFFDDETSGFDNPSYFS